MKKIMEIILTIYYVLFLLYYITTGGHSGNNFFSTYDEFSELAAAVSVTVPYLIYLGLLDFKKYMIDIVYFLILVIPIYIYEEMNLIERSNYNLSDVYAFVVLIYCVYAVLHKWLLNKFSKKEAKYTINFIYILTQFIMIIIMISASSI